MMTYEVVMDVKEIEDAVVPLIQSHGAEVPQSGTYAAAVARNENGQVEAYLLLQQALVIEGLYSRNREVNIRRLVRLLECTAQRLGANVLLATATEGSKVASVAHRLGYKTLNLTIGRKWLCRVSD